LIDVLFGFRARAQRRKGAVEELRNKKQKIRNKEVELKYFRNPQPLELIEHIEPLEPFFCLFPHIFIVIFFLLKVLKNNFYLKRILNFIV
jgi:hypothetical protein